MAAVWNQVVCPGCGCLCDDISLQLESQQVVEFEPSCELGRRWFQSNLRAVETPYAVHGQSADYRSALQTATDLLRNADYPLIYGLSRSSTPGQRAAVALGDFLGGVVDTTASLCHGPSIIAQQEVGEVTCTLGEIRNRADLVIFWGCNPADSHPRHAERYSVHPKGRFLPDGRADRKIVMIGRQGQIDDWRLDHAGTEPDLKIAIEPGRDFETIEQLAIMLENPSIQSESQPLNELMHLMRRCNYGVFFFGLGLAETGAWGGTERTGTGHINVAALLKLVADLNAVTRFTARRMRLQGDVSGADNVLCWQTSYPFGVDFSRGYPRHNPGETTANELLERRDVDVALLVGAETVPFFTTKALAHLAQIPTIILDYPGAAKLISPSVYFTTAVYGLHASGTAYRMDNVPLSLREMVPSDLPTDEKVLADMLAQLAGSCAGQA